MNARQVPGTAAGRSWCAVLAAMAIAVAANCSGPGVDPPATRPAEAEYPVTSGDLPHLDVPRATTQPRVDAGADDPAWKDAALVPRLTLSVGVDGTKYQPLPTEVRLLWDEDWLYVRFDCTDAWIYAPHKNRDDPHHQGDVVEVFLDPVGDCRQYVELQVSPANVIFDQQMLLTREPKFSGRMLSDQTMARDLWGFPSWNFANLRTAVLQHEGGWRVDIAVPAKELLRRTGRERFGEMTIRAHLMRYDWTAPREDKNRVLIAMNWAPVPYGCPHISPGAMGFLHLKDRPAPVAGP